MFARSIETGLDIKEALSAAGWASVRSSLVPFPKFLSVAALSCAGLPIAPIIVFSTWSNETQRNVSRFIEHHSFQRVQVRSETVSKQVGGKAYYALPIDDIPRACSDLFGSGADIVGIQHPGDIFRNNYSAQIAFETDADDVSIDIVGPGFTASALSKGGLLHERTTLGRLGRAIVSSRMVDSKVYREDVAALMSKYGKEALVENGSLLLSNAEAYTPLPSHKVEYLVRRFPKMYEAARWLGQPDRRAIVSMSWLMSRIAGEGESAFFWDLHWYDQMRRVSLSPHGHPSLQIK